MTIVVEVDWHTQQRLSTEALKHGKSLEEYAAELLTRSVARRDATRKPNLGFAAGRGIWIADNFDEPLEEPNN